MAEQEIRSQEHPTERVRREDLRRKSRSEDLGVFREVRRQEFFIVLSKSEKSAKKLFLEISSRNGSLPAPRTPAVNHRNTASSDSLTPDLPQADIGDLSFIPPKIVSQLVEVGNLNLAEKPFPPIIRYFSQGVDK